MSDKDKKTPGGPEYTENPKSGNVEFIRPIVEQPSKRSEQLKSGPVKDTEKTAKPPRPKN